MYLSCPQCLTGYDIEGPLTDTTLVCHRCGIEFSVSAQPHNPPPEETAGNEVEAEKPESESQDEELTEMIPPKRKKVRIWTWLIAVLILVSSGGFWLQQELWLDNRWVRSTAINFGITIPLRDKDWDIDTQSVRTEWFTREDGSRVLVIRGRVKNLLSSELPPPAIEITYFSREQPDKTITSKRFPITLPPSNSVIGRLPYSSPVYDQVPIAPLGEREFVFVIESLPNGTGDFSLIARTASPEESG